MILSPGSTSLDAPTLLALLALAAYAVAALPLGQPAAARLSAPALAVAVATHALMLVMEITGAPGPRLGFASVLSLTVCLVLAVHAVESRLVPLPAVRRALALAGAAAVLLALAFPAEPRHSASPWVPLHWLLGVASYGLFGAAVLHGLMLDAAERRLRSRKVAPAGGSATLGMPLLQLERLTFRFVQAGFAVLSVAIVFGAVTAEQWRWDHKTVLSLLSWGLFAALLVGRHRHGWRGQRATRWLYAGALVLLLAYVGSRFVLEVVLGRLA